MDKTEGKDDRQAPAVDDKAVEAMLNQEAEAEGDRDLKGGTAAEPEESAGERAGEDRTAAENRRLKRELKRRQDEIDRLKREGERAEEAEDFKAMSPAELREAAKTNPQAKAWLDLIQEEARAQATEALRPVRDASYRGAVRRFAEAFPEYAATPEGRGRFREVEAVAKRNGMDAAGDEGAMFDLLVRSKAFCAPPPAPDPGRDRARRFAAEHSAATVGERADEGDFTQAEIDQAREHNMTPEEYRKAASVYGPHNRVETR